jgi:glycosyltransferase involved in cell wall biosynthesis
VKVSVIIRAYNRGYIIAEAIDCALRQTYPDLEIVVVDDGSTDNTQESVDGFRSDRIRYIRHEQNRGVGAACNTGVASSTGEAIAILDSDDLWVPEKIERQASFLDAHPEVGAVFCDVKILAGEELVPSLARVVRAFPMSLSESPAGKEYCFSTRQMYECLLEDVPIKPSAVLMRRDALLSAGAFKETRSGEDWELFLRLSRVFAFGYIDKALATQRVMADSTLMGHFADDKRFLIAIFSGEKSRLKHDRAAIAAVNRGLSEHYKSLGGNLMTEGRHFRSFGTYLKGFVETGSIELLLRAPVAFTPSTLRRLIKKVLPLGHKF